MASEPSTSVQRSVDILFALGDAGAAGRDLGVSEIARLVGREKSQVSRALKTLAALGLVDRDVDTLAYRLGWRLFTLAESAGHHRLVTLAAPVLRDLVARTGECAHLTVLQGDHVLTVLTEQSPYGIQVTTWIGRSSPIHATSSGRALLLSHSDESIRRLLADTRFDGGGPRAPRTMGALLNRVRMARRRGYALVDEEFEPGVVAAAAPVYDSRSHIVAAVNVSVPKYRLRRRLDALGHEVKRAADGLSRLLREPAERTRPA